MDNFDYKKFLAEGKLHEAMSPQDVVDIADTVAEEFTKESAEAGDFLVYSVGRMEADDMSFELDTDLTSQSPKSIDTRGVGEGWGGIFRIKPTEDGYEVRNAEKGGLVAMIDTMGNFKMLSADESRAEMGLEEEINENKPSNKMKKSELKEMIKMAMLEDARTDAEQEGYKDGFEDAKEDVEDALKKMKVSEAEEEDVDVEKDVNVDVDDTEDVDVDIEKDVKVDDEETEADIDVKASVSGESEDVEAVQGLLTKALEMSQALGDEKLEDQIGNTITYFTRAHVSRVNEMDVDSVSTNIDDVAAAEIGLDEAKDEEVKENLNESVVFPMWNKIK